MPRVSQCPECEKSLKIPDEKTGSVVRCPQCGNRFRAPGNTSRRKSRPSGTRSKRLPQKEDSFDDDDFAPAPLRRKKTRQKHTRKTATSSDLRPVVRGLIIVLGISLALSIPFAIAGIFSQTPALIASGICVVAILGCVLVGRIWMSIDLGKESPLQGIVAFFVPLAGLAMSLTKKGPPLRGAIVYMSAIAPGILLGLMLLVFLPKYDASYGRSARSSSVAMKPETWAGIIKKLEDEAGLDAAVISVSAKVTGQKPGVVEDLASRGESLLSQFRTYETGSLKVDVAGRTLTFQYRGLDRTRNAFANFLSLSTDTFVSAGP